MEHDPDRRRFFAYLNLFVASMLLLVLADSYLLLFVGWEGVGLASYLLIGFWNYNPAYATAAKKAFVANRVGDFGLVIAIVLMFATFGRSTSPASTPASRARTTGVAHRDGSAAAARRLRQVGAVPAAVLARRRDGRPDAGVGADPRRDDGHRRRLPDRAVAAPHLQRRRPTAQLVVVIVGAITLVFGAVVGCAKDDIKKALAASTMSQIGYMMLAAGLGPVGYAFAIFHLLTHGFFKAGMFLGAGSVMHGMNDQVDMRRLRRAVGRHEDHLGHLRPRLAGDPRCPAVLRLLEQGQDHRGRVRRRGLAALGVRRRPR